MPGYIVPLPSLPREGSAGIGMGMGIDAYTSYTAEFYPGLEDSHSEVVRLVPVDTADDGDEVADGQTGPTGQGNVFERMGMRRHTPTPRPALAETVGGPLGETVAASAVREAAADGAIVSESTRCI